MPTIYDDWLPNGIVKNTLDTEQGEGESPITMIDYPNGYVKPPTPFSIVSQGGGGGGAESFFDLNDTPTDPPGFVGQGLRALRANLAETEFEFFDVFGVTQQTRILHVDQNVPSLVQNGSLAAPYNSIQDAIDAIPVPTSAAEEKVRWIVSPASDDYDEDVNIPAHGGLEIAIIGKGAFTLGAGDLPNHGSTVPRSLTWNTANTTEFGEVRPTLILGVRDDSETSSTHVAYAGGFVISGNLNIVNPGGADITTKEMHLYGVKVSGDLDGSGDAGILNLYARRCFFDQVANLPTANLNIFESTEVDGLLTCDTYGRVWDCQIQGGMTHNGKNSNIPPTGVFRTELSGVITSAFNLEFDVATETFSGGVAFAGGGAPEQIDFFTAAAQGSILYKDALNWNYLAPGAIGDFLQTQGAGANPVWAPAGGGASPLTIVGPTDVDSGMPAQTTWDFGVANAVAGYSAFCEGDGNTINGNYAHAEGQSNYATSNFAHVENTLNTASGFSSHAQGNLSTASGSNAHAEGRNSTSSGFASHAEGRDGTASGNASHVEGSGCQATGYTSHAEGYYSVASNSHAHAEGFNSVASGFASHGEGASANAYGIYSHSEGVNGDANAYAHAEGFVCQATGYSSHAEGSGTDATGYASHSEGEQTLASAYRAHAEGWQSTASGMASHAEGRSTSGGDYSHSEGRNTQSSGNYSHAEGNASIASAASSHAEGNSTDATATAAHAEGNSSLAAGEFSHAEGDESTCDVTAFAAHSEGVWSRAWMAGQNVGGGFSGTGISNRGDAQESKTRLYGTANGGLSANLANDTGPDVTEFPGNLRMAWGVRIDIIGLDLVSGDATYWEAKGCVKEIGGTGTMALVGGAFTVTEVRSDSPATYTVTVGLNPGLTGIRITGVAPGGTTMKWSAVVRSVELNN